MDAIKRTAEYYRRALLDGDRRALSRAITAVESEGAESAEVYKAIRGRLGSARVIGITGAPGAGKSTLLGACIGEWRRRGKTVGVVAVDPSSPFSGGAILGDRVRMSEHGTDDGVFIRSVASRGHLGGLSRSTSRVVDVLDAAGFDVVVVETVGTGQSEVEIMELAQTVVVVCAPGLGDEIQAVKAGILEIAHILAVSKSDTPGAARAERQLARAAELASRGGWQVPVVRVSGVTGEGIAELIDTTQGHYDQLNLPKRRDGARERTRKLLATTAGRVARGLIDDMDPATLEAEVTRVLDGTSDLEGAALLLMKKAIGQAN